jgi:hypothetical protein
MDSSAVHAVIVGGSVIVHDIGAVAYHRVDGKPSTLRHVPDFARDARAGVDMLVSHLPE